MDTKFFQWMADGIDQTREIEKKMQATPARASTKKKLPTESEQQFATSVRKAVIRFQELMKDSPEIESYASATALADANRSIQKQSEQTKEAEKLRKAEAKKVEENIGSLQQEIEKLRKEIDILKASPSTSSSPTKQQISQIARGVDTLLKASPARNTAKEMATEDFRLYLTFKQDVLKDPGSCLVTYHIAKHTF
jgi:regulator of replication initiation timing